MGAPKAKVEKDNAERWLLTYSDLMNLLLILFIILFAMSQIDATKFNQLAASLRAAFGDSTSASYIGTAGSSNSLIELDAGSSSVIPENLENQQMEQIKSDVDIVIKNSGLSNQVIVTIEERGVEITIRDSLLFSSGSANIQTEKAKKTIMDIGKILATLPKNQMRVEGYTDNDPIKTSQFPSNWELSSARATNVLRLLVDTAKLDPTIISAVGYGEYRPKVPNTSEENKAQNRRVSIVIVKNSYDKAEAEIPGLEQKTENTSHKPTQ